MKAKRMNIVNGLIDELRTMLDGTETTVYQLVEQCGYDVKTLEQNDELFTVYSDLCKAARKAHITFEYQDNGGIPTGLPYRLPLVVRNDAAQIKCPRCGSKHTASILYGMPVHSKELEARLDAGRLHLGWCCVTGYEPQYYCNECKKTFGAVAQVIIENEITPLTDLITEVKYSEEVYRLPLPSPQVTIKKTGDGAHVEASGWAKGLRFFDDYDISKKRWDTLINKLYNDLFLNDWKHKHDLSDADYVVCDGMSWELVIVLEGNRKRTYSGENAFPPYWKEFMRLMRPFMKPKKV